MPGIRRFTTTESVMATPKVINEIFEQAEALFHQGQFAAAS